MESKEVEYNFAKYIVIKVDNILSVLDKDDFEKFLTRDVHISMYNNYVSLSTKYLHTLIMDPPKEKTVDHISRNPRDNRKVNLRVASQTEQNHNTKRRSRTVNLPEGCGINDEDIPRCVWYIHVNGKHGDGFCIQLKGHECLGQKDFRWKSTRSVSVSLKDKLKSTIEKLEELRNLYPQLRNVIVLKPEHEEKREKLANEFNDILRKSGYPQDIIMKNIFEFVSDLDVPSRKQIEGLPSSSSIKHDMIPTNCKFIPGDTYRGDRFAIMNYKELSNTSRQYWYTSSSKTNSLDSKFEELMEKLKELKVND